ncbi:hypothetical protein B7R54_15080 [Subtercola boreus]|uniref:Tyrosine specific protein phosphatases domain-containing protein n=1 Tax=Subtercola boreus TaxID=120213 RepID=A0A3E0VKY5_9MICO|nr:tyrosine-protein phosphatase [Subtercola boreus]RFA10381.1 hypothetical protein B7R54_15080 [Subtercola boreus]TQL56103.1 protein-tyrosine phosphatase [Subtercola boreus]
MIAGVQNLRDLGGTVAAGGAVVAPGRLYRAELLTDTSPNESNATWTEAVDEGVALLGLAAVIDLRSVPEKNVSPSRWVRDGTLYVEIPIDDGAPGSSTDLMKAVLAGTRDLFTVDDMELYYRSMLAGRAVELATGVAAIADAAGAPVLVHCSAGKDRTGVLIAMVLDLLGVARDDVLSDYEETGRRRPDRVLEYTALFARHGLTVEQVRPMFETPRRALAGALADVDERYGSVEAYLSERGGLEAGTADRLRSALLTER